MDCKHDVIIERKDMGVLTSKKCGDCGFDFLSSPTPRQPADQNFSEVRKQCIQYVERTDCCHVDCDCEHYIFEAAIEAVYGKDIWKYINSLKS